MFALITDTQKLRDIARDVRIDIIRMLAEAQSGHPGGSLSATDILTVLYFHVLRHDPERPHWPDRDRFILSKGHGVPALYAVLAKAGYIPHEELLTLRQTGSRLQGHPDRMKLDAIEAATGSLGQGLSIALGLALASQHDGNPYRVYCMVGDGESQAGQIWEAAMCAPKFKLGNLTCILDYNKIQLDGYTRDILDLEPVVDKWRAFGWNTIEIDGHDIDQIREAFVTAARVSDRPSIIIAHTVKGKGVSFMEDLVKWHGVAPTQDEADQAVAELQNG